MQMTLTITAESPSELVTVLAALQGAGVGAPVQLKAVARAPEPKEEDAMVGEAGACCRQAVGGPERGRSGDHAARERDHDLGRAPRADRVPGRQ